MRLAIAALAVMAAACAGPDVVKIKDPGPVPDLTTTTAVDYSQIGLKGVSNRGTTSIPLGPGAATISGTVTGPDGPVDAATVRVERLVANAIAAVDVATMADGTWSVPKVFGGRYRVRAWKTPDLALTKPQIFFLQGSEQKKLDLRVDRYAGLTVTASIAPNPPVIGEPTNLSVLIAEKQVDAGGVARAVPVVSAIVELAGTGYQLETGNPTSTDGNGVAEWRVRCTDPLGTLSATVSDGASYPLGLPECVPSGTTPEPTTTSTTTRGRSTPSTRR